MRKNSVKKNLSSDLRDLAYLEDTMFRLWEDHFSDVPRRNLVLIKFGRYSKRRLGSIKWANKDSRIKSLLKKRLDLWKISDDKRITIIMVTRHFEDLYIPNHVVDMTIAHEMVHYAHGFQSPLPRLYSKPHQGSIVKNELRKRGLGELYDSSDDWLKKNWANYIIKNHKR